MNITKTSHKNWFHYHNCKTHSLHGLYNRNNTHIGYCYQNKIKGFWLK